MRSRNYLKSEAEKTINKGIFSLLRRVKRIFKIIKNK